MNPLVIIIHLLTTGGDLISPEGEIVDAEASSGGGVWSSLGAANINEIHVC